MARRDSSNDVPPMLGQQYPLYPDLPQLVRRTFAAPIPIHIGSVTTTIYPGFVQQWSPPLTLRDREACYLWEPNGVPLETGIYDCRLIGSHAGLPLYATTCCAPGTSSSSSSVAPGCHLARVGPYEPAEGLLIYGGFPPVAFDSIVVENGEMLLVVVFLVGKGVLGETPLAFFGGEGGFDPMTLQYTFDLPGVSSSAGTIDCRCAVFTILGFDQGRLRVDSTPRLQTYATTAVFGTVVRGLTDLAVDQIISATGSGTAPDTGLIDPTGQDCEYAQATFGMLNPDVASSLDWSWDLPFLNGNENGTGGYIGASYPGVYRFGVTEGYDMVTAAGPVDGRLLGTLPATWGGVLVTLK